jgi:hypothetical protein
MMNDEGCNANADRILSFVKTSIASPDFVLPHGWLTVSKALLLPEPDTSWMSNPISRREFTGWIKDQ